MLQELSKEPVERSFVTAESMGISESEFVSMALYLQQNGYLRGCRFVEIDQSPIPVKVILNSAEVTKVGVQYYMKQRDIG